MHVMGLGSAESGWNDIPSAACHSIGMNPVGWVALLRMASDCMPDGVRWDGVHYMQGSLCCMGCVWMLLDLELHTIWPDLVVTATLGASVSHRNSLGGLDDLAARVRNDER